MTVEKEWPLRLSQIQQQIGNDEYRVDARAVAEAIVRRLFSARVSIEPKPAQGECS